MNYDLNIPSGWRLLNADETPKHGDRYLSNGAGGDLWFPIEIMRPEDRQHNPEIIRYE